MNQFRSDLAAINLSDKQERHLDHDTVLMVRDDAARQRDEQLRGQVLSWLATTKPSLNHNMNRR